MELLLDILIQHIRIFFCCLDATMAQLFLHGPKILLLAI